MSSPLRREPWKPLTAFSTTMRTPSSRRSYLPPPYHRSFRLPIQSIAPAREGAGDGLGVDGGWVEAAEGERVGATTPPVAGAGVVDSG